MSAKLFVGNLNPKTTGDQLTRFFSSAGLIVSVRMPLDRQTGRPRGFAFVEFASLEQAEQALRVFDGRELGGSRLRISLARPEADDRRGRAKGRPQDQIRQIDESARVPGPEAFLERARSNDEDPYAERWSRKSRHHGKHGSDRKRRQGSRRYLD
jgi:RNA recognition motif-containing protein